jgi:hypothetical protein
MVCCYQPAGLHPINGKASDCAAEAQRALSKEVLIKRYSELCELCNALLLLGTGHVSLATTFLTNIEDSCKELKQSG